MKIENLTEGQVFKNYKELCKTLEIPVKSGNTKKAQMNELDRYCLLKRDGNKLIIQELFEAPHPKSNGNTIYGELLTLLITDTLIDKWKRTENSTVFMTRNNILQDTKMINHNYSFCSVNVAPLSNLLKINIETVNDFFNSTSSSFRYAVESALKELRNRSLIMYDQTTMICNESNKHSKATYDEMEFILQCEREIFESLGYDNLTQVRNSRNWDIFKRNVKKKLVNSTYRIKFYYTTYEITLNTSYIESSHNKELISLVESMDSKKERDNMNVIICERLLENAKNRALNTSRDSKHFELRSSTPYLKENQLLIDTLIDTQHKDVKEDIYKVIESHKVKGF